jgi:hypothetical protein
LIKEIGQPLGQLIAFSKVLIVRKKTANRFVERLVQTQRQKLHQPPKEFRLVKRRGFWDVYGAKHRAVHLPKEP